MKGKISKWILGGYDLILAFGAIYLGIQMVLGKFWDGEWPSVWMDKVPFTSWFWPGVIAICIYGIGNLIAAYYSFSNKEKGYLASGIMGALFLVSLLLSFLVLGEGYLATSQFILLSIIQLLLVFFTSREYFLGSIFIIVSLALIIGYVTYASRPYSALGKHNLVVINNSGESLKGFGYKYLYSSHYVENADGSLFKPNKKFYINMDVNLFTLTTTDSEGKTYTSKGFDLDFKDNEIYRISIEKNEGNKLDFVLLE